MQVMHSRFSKTNYVQIKTNAQKTVKTGGISANMKKSVCDQ